MDVGEGRGGSSRQEARGERRGVADSDEAFDETRRRWERFVGRWNEVGCGCGCSPLSAHISSDLRGSGAEDSELS